MLFHSVSTLGNSNASSYKKIGYGNRDAMLDSRLEVCLSVCLFLEKSDFPNILKKGYSCQLLLFVVPV